MAFMFFPVLLVVVGVEYVEEYVAGHTIRVNPKRAKIINKSGQAGTWDVHSS
jgi:hypothetical protein